MNVKFESRFEKDLKLVKDRNLLTRLKQIILTCKQSESLGEINHLKKMQGYESFYRIRSQHQTAIAPQHPNPDLLFPSSNSNRLNGQNLAFKLVYNQAVRCIFTLQR